MHILFIHEDNLLKSAVSGPTPAAMHTKKQAKTRQAMYV